MVRKRERWLLVVHVYTGQVQRAVPAGSRSSWRGLASSQLLQLPYNDRCGVKEATVSRRRRVYDGRREDGARAPMACRLGYRAAAICGTPQLSSVQMHACRVCRLFHRRPALLLLPPPPPLRCVLEDGTLDVGAGACRACIIWALFRSRLVFGIGVRIFIAKFL